MSQINFSIAPDISPQRIPGWFLFASSLHKVLGMPVRAVDFQSYEDQNNAFNKGEIDLVYANPCDTGALVRHKNFIPIARPVCDVTEVTIVTQSGSGYNKMTAVPKHPKIAVTENNDLRMLGLILLEPAGVQKSDVTFLTAPNHILAIKKLLSGEVDLAFIPSTTFKGLSPAIAKDLRALVATTASDMETVSHCFLISPRLIDKIDALKCHFLQMDKTPAGQMMLEDIGVRAWEVLDDPDEINYMIDLVIALQA